MSKVSMSIKEMENFSIALKKIKRIIIEFLEEFKYNDDLLRAVHLDLVTNISSDWLVILLVQSDENWQVLDVLIDNLKKMTISKLDGYKQHMKEKENA